MSREQPSLRISDADREQAASDLSEHYAEGRLSHDEHAERLDAIWTARTHADLTPIFEDLPARRSTTAGAARAPQGHRRWHGLPFLPVAAALVLLSILTHLPFWILIFFVGCGLFTRRHRIDRDHHFGRTRTV
ncbi:MAG: DUF1707 domain-containing protein [Actinomycetota bacterium]|nr:DUF1707 domain-containing protein [Actinomycetota bacterium]